MTPNAELLEDVLCNNSGEVMTSSGAAIAVKANKVSLLSNIKPSGRTFIHNYTSTPPPGIFGS